MLNWIKSRVAADAQMQAAAQQRDAEPGEIQDPDDDHDALVLLTRDHPRSALMWKPVAAAAATLAGGALAGGALAGGDAGRWGAGGVRAGEAVVNERTAGDQELVGRDRKRLVGRATGS